jgi:L-fucose isomerase-like protein
VERIRVLRKYKNKLEKKKPMLAGKRTLYRIGAESQAGGFPGCWREYGQFGRTIPEKTVSV